MRRSQSYRIVYRVKNKKTKRWNIHYYWSGKQFTSNIRYAQTFDDILKAIETAHNLNITKDSFGFGIQTIQNRISTGTISDQDSGTKITS